MKFLTLFSNLGLFARYAPVAPSNIQIAQLLLYSAIELVGLEYLPIMLTNASSSQKKYL